MSPSLRHKPTSYLAALGLLGAVACAGSSGQANLQSAEGETNASLTAAAAPTWTLSPTLATARCLTPLRGSSENGTPIVLADCDGSAAQAWTRTGDDNSLALTLFDTKCIDVADGLNTNGTKLQLWDCFTLNDNQKWAYKGGALQWLKTQKCFDLTDGRVADNNNVLQVWDCNVPNDNQQWKFVASPTKAAAPTTSPNAVISTDSNAVPVVVSPVDYASVDVSSMTMAGRRGIAAVVNQASSASCMAVASFPGNPTLVVSPCQDAAAEQFAFDGNGRIGYPSQQTEVSGVTYAKGAYCLSVGMAGRSNAGLPVFVPCNSGDVGQVWGQAGNVLVSASIKTCLGSDPNGQNPNAIVLQPCTTRPQQAWSLQQ